MWVNSVALFVDGSWCSACLASSIKIFLATKFFSGKLSSGYIIYVRP